MDDNGGSLSSIDPDFGMRANALRNWGTIRPDAIVLVNRGTSGTTRLASTSSLVRRPSRSPKPTPRAVMQNDLNWSRLRNVKDQQVCEPRPQGVFESEFPVNVSTTPPKQGFRIFNRRLTKMTFFVRSLTLSMVGRSRDERMFFNTRNLPPLGIVRCERDQGWLVPWSIGYHNVKSTISSSKSNQMRLRMNNATRTQRNLCFSDSETITRVVKRGLTSP